MNADLRALPPHILALVAATANAETAAAVRAECERRAAAVTPATSAPAEVAPFH